MSQNAISVRAAAALFGLEADQLWIGCLALGGTLITAQQVADALSDTPPDEADAAMRNILGLVLNEHALDHGIAPLFLLLEDQRGRLFELIADNRRRSRALRARAERATRTTAELAASYARVAAHTRYRQH